jgi:hypothetical protein
MALVVYSVVFPSVLTPYILPRDTRGARDTHQPDSNGPRELVTVGTYGINSNHPAALSRPSQSP